MPNTTVDRCVANAKDLGLPEDAYSYDWRGSVVGRTAKARRIFESAEDAKIV